MNWYKKSTLDHLSVDKNIYIKPLLSDGSIEIWLVRGDIIRKNHSVDFTLGGHDKVYDFIPKNEVWIDDDTPKDEINFVILHELRERRLIINGMGYEKAHDQASILEVLCRKNKIDAKEMVDKEIEKNKNELV